ncbi:SDR family oxidoreductase [Streptococcus macacae]|uniref:3-beta hydroxysteroid dehydrogenase/isomerase family protein n=1 Tax=Streptococcus macacae NCTC 11558 TaxID=764298 RepID=G5JX59_9STRE|nr:SDR family oxidoreductase [Streptococcus macacae]EHJ53232.1 3-beta hydroxysteroid dehydrogenase/isomerase family protein [Streptococcus macacae NCTC 11558]SUN77832.1 reductase [Streptococcus macacae NCTC 11558]
MNTNNSSRTIRHAFVTGATGLLGNNLVRALLKENIEVTALVRSMDKAKQQFDQLPIHLVQGDILKPESYKDYLADCDSLFHTAAFFRDSHKGGKHWQELYDTNITGTLDLLQAAYDAGIRQIVHTSSIAVLKGEPNQLIDETMSRDPSTKIEYYRSKILSDQAVHNFLDKHPDAFITFVLPGSMYGPGDMGPTSTGQMILNYMQQKLPGIIKASYSVADARDVADIHILAMKYGRNRERYLAAGRYMTMEEVMKTLEKVSGIPAPKKRIPMPLLRLFAIWNEIYHFITGKPILVSKDLVELFNEEYQRTHFDQTKMKNELGGQFRPVEETMLDTIKWYRNHGYLS